MSPSHDILARLIRRFAENQCSWISTVRPDGRPHATPIWHVWRAGRAFIVTRAAAVKATNIRLNPNVVITHTDARFPVIIEGRASFAPEAEEALRPLFLAKYDWDISTDADYDTIIAITPEKIIAWGEEDGRRWQKNWSGQGLMGLDEIDVSED
jgi:general stress protein 26